MAVLIFVLFPKKMSLEESNLIDEIEKYPHLWDKNDSQFKDEIAIEYSWKDISLTMGLTVAECQDMWQSIRLKFIRERRQLKNIPSGSGAYTCKWPLYEKLGFLHGVINTRKIRRKGNIFKKIETHSTTSSLNSFLESTPTGNKIFKDDSLLNNFLQSTPTENTISKDDYYFGLSIGESLSKVQDEKKKLQVKAEILMKISEIID